MCDADKKYRNMILVFAFIIHASSSFGLGEGNLGWNRGIGSFSSCILIPSHLTILGLVVYLGRVSLATATNIY